MKATADRTTWILGEAFKCEMVRADVPSNAGAAYGSGISISAAQHADFIFVRYAPFADSQDPNPFHPKHRGVTCIMCERQGVNVYMYCDQDVQQHAAIHGAVLREERSK